VGKEHVHAMLASDRQDGGAVGRHLADAPARERAAKPSVDRFHES
jgi:hypothetical protein